MVCLPWTVRTVSVRGHTVVQVVTAMTWPSIVKHPLTEYDCVCQWYATDE